MTQRNELERFLDLMHAVSPNLNDCFSYATADIERLATDEVGSEGDTDMLLRVFREYDHAGILAYCARIRGTHPIPPLRTPEYEAAYASLEEWEYEGD